MRQKKSPHEGGQPIFTNIYNYITTPIERLLPRLQKVRSRGPSSWVACCPAHEDTSPSLSIRETEDHTLLIHCFTGCSVGAVTAAVGLQVSDLFPADPGDDYGPRRKARAPAFPWRDAIRALYRHLLVVQIAAARLAAGDKLGEQDLNAMLGRPWLFPA